LATDLTAPTAAPTVTHERTVAERVRKHLEALGYSTTDPHQEQVKAWQRQVAAQQAAESHRRQSSE